ncbi:hypothetical protein [Sorangium sp. So ce887]|uniref:hypothetical protein n=1 Tax=Sorangium sp. So ce887 TaxID=3133324 RepID=UPI003F5F1ABB
MTRRRAILWGAAAVAAVAVALLTLKLTRFPPDTTPEGAYLRIAYRLGANDLRTCFSYLEDRAQHAAYTIRDYRQKASERIEASYPEPERTRLLEQYRAHATAEDGADVWVDIAAKQGFVARLRRDLSGVAKVEVTGERATVETARGTRYPFRRRDNGIWGLTLFTADLVAEAERAARDWDVVEKAALDYERGR